MVDTEGLIVQTGSADPVERINARVQLLREFPADADQKLKGGLFCQLSDDVKANREQTLEYVFGISELEPRAYAIGAVDWGLSVRKTEVPPPMGEQRAVRKRFVRGVEGLAESLGEIEDLKSRLRVAEVIAREGHQKQALMTIDKTWEIGWDRRVVTTFYGESASVNQTVADSLENTVLYANLKTVRQRALHHLSEISDNGKRENYLARIMASKNAEMAVKATDLYVEKVEPLKQDRASVALDAIMSRVVGFGRDVLRTASQPAVERAFDLYIGLLPAEQRLLKVYDFTTIHFSAWLDRRRQGVPKGLNAKVREYLSGHVGDATRIEDTAKRNEVLVKIAEMGTKEASVKAVDYLAKPGDQMQGVKNVAEMYTRQDWLMQLPEVARDKVVRWAVGYTRRFVSLEDKELARRALRGIAGWPDESEGDGAFYREGKGGSGESYAKIALAELAKLPDRPTEQVELRKVFAGSTA